MKCDTVHDMKHLSILIWEKSCRLIYTRAEYKQSQMKLCKCSDDEKKLTYYIKKCLHLQNKS